MGKNHASQYANFGSLHFFYGMMLVKYRLWNLRKLYKTGYTLFFCIIYNIVFKIFLYYIV